MGMGGDSASSTREVRIRTRYTLHVTRYTLHFILYALRFTLYALDCLAFERHLLLRIRIVPAVKRRTKP